jgi:hypothetical protein
MKVMEYARKYGSVEKGIVALAAELKSFNAN